MDTTCVYIQLQVCRQYNSAINENKALKQDQDNLLASLKKWQQKYNYIMQESVEGKTKERIANLQGIYGELKLALDKVIKTLTKTANVSNY